MTYRDIENEENLYIVHKTDFFPRDHIIRSTYDGNRIYTTDNDGEEIIVNLGEESKRVLVPSHRHTTHFTINSVVQPAKDGAGNWDDKPIAIIEPFEPHREQFVSYGDGDSIAWGSVKLSDNAVIIIRRDALNLIPETEQGKWNIIVSDEENIAKSVQEYFRERNIPIIGYEDHAGHSFSQEYRLENNLQKRDMAINFLRNNTFDGKEPIDLTIDEISQVFNIQHDKNNRPGSIKPSTEIYLSQRKNGMAPSEFYDLVIANGFTMDESGKYVLKKDEEIFRQMTEILENSGKIDDKTFEDIETIYSNYMNFISEKSPDELSDFEAEMIRKERERVKAIREMNPDELTDFQQIAIARDDARLLGTKRSELDEDDTKRVNSLKPQPSINYRDSGYSLRYNIIENTSEWAAKEFGLHDEVVFVIQADEESQKEFWDNPDSKEYREKCELIANKTSGAKEITPIIDPYDGFPTEFRLSMPIQREDETYGEFYARIQSYIDGVQELMSGREVIFGEEGAITQNNVERPEQVQTGNVQQQEQIQSNNDQLQEKVQLESDELYEQVQAENVQQQDQVEQENAHQQESHGITLQEIGRETIESFKRNPQEAAKMIETVERGIAEREDKGNEKQ